MVTVAQDEARPDLPAEPPVEPSDAALTVAIPDDERAVVQLAQLPDALSLRQLCNLLVASGFFPNVKGVAQAVVKVLAGKELGFGPIASMRNIDVIQGSVSFRYPLIGAVIKRHPRYDFRVKTLTNEKAELDFFEKRDEGGEWEVIGTSTFTKDDADKAGLLKKPGATWSQYSRNMLFARALTNGARWFVPDVFFGGVYTPDELQPQPQEEPSE